MTAMLLLLAAVQAPAAPVEIHFCPPSGVRAYPLDSLHGVQGLLVQNVAIINRGQAPVTIDGISLGLANGETLIERRQVEGRALDAAIAGGQALKAQGLLDLYKFQFCDGKLAGWRVASGEP